MPDEAPWTIALVAHDNRKDDLVGYQASTRGGTVRVRLRGERVDLLGRAMTLVRGTWTG